MEMQQLLSMGFPEDTAAQALAATGGGCPLKATEWILTHSQKNSSNDNNNNNLNPINNSPNSAHYQPKLDRFFRFHSKPPRSTPSPSPALNEAPPTDSSEEKGEKDDDNEKEEDAEAQRRKRRKRETAVQSPPLHEPLSERMRPRRIDEVVGQDHLLGRNSFLRSAVDLNRLPSVIFWGPPGTGKTSIARAIVSSCPASSYRFVSLSAVTCGVKDVRDAVEEARKWMKVAFSKSRCLKFMDSFRQREH